MAPGDPSHKPLNCAFLLIRSRKQCCSGLEKSPFGAKSDFEIWEFKAFFFGPEKSLKEGLWVATTENLNEKIHNAI